MIGQHGAQVFNDILRISDRSRAIPEQRVRPFTARIERKTRNNEKLTAHIERLACCDQGTRALGSFNNALLEPATSLLRRGKSCARAVHSNGISE